MNEILLSKLDYYGTWITSNNWFKTYLCNCKQFVSINGYGSGFTEINCGVSQGSVPGGPLLFLLYTNNLNQAIKLFKVHHFADETKFLYLGKSVKTWQLWLKRYAVVYQSKQNFTWC